MSLTIEKSAEVHKKAVLDRSKKTTDSPIKDIPIKEKIELARSEYGKEVADKIIADDINKRPQEKIQILTPEDVQNRTGHLINFDLINQVVSLQGVEYRGMIKEIYKMMISLSVPEHLRVIRVGEIETDLRVCPNIILSSGKGKKNIAECVKRIYKTYNPEGNIKEPRTIHYQHLIGKMLLRKEKVDDGETKTGKQKYKTIETWIPKYGYLNSDLLILEEAYELFNSPEKNDIDCRDAILVGLDCYGKNLIMKQNMDNLDTKEETLSYHPYTSILSFSQPLMFQENFITKGLSRRMHICYRDFPERTGLDRYVNRLISKVDDEKSCVEFAQYMRKINNIKTKWKLSSDAIETFIICHGALLEQGFRQGGKVAHYTRILEFPMQNLLLKMSALQALSNFRTEITKEDVEFAFVDTIERLIFEFKFVEKKVKGTLDYGESWGGAVGKSQQCLEELYNLGAINKETSVNIWVFQKIIERVYDISNRRSKDRYKNMKVEVLISDYLGQGKDNGVWLNFKPKLKMKDDDIDEKLNPINLYFNILGMTGMSGMTPKTGITHINKSKSLIYIENTKGIINHKKVVYKKNIISKKDKLLNNSLSVIADTPDTPKRILSEIIKKEKETPVIPEIKKSDKDVQYNEAKETQNIKPTHTKKEVLEYIKSKPKTSILELYKKFGANVMILKKGGLI